MPDAFSFIWLRTRRARRGGAMLLVALWTMFWLSQAYAGCCGPNGGNHHPPISPAMEIHAIVQSDHEGSNHPQEPICPQTLDEKFTIASAQIGTVADSWLTQLVFLPQAPPLRFAPPQAGNDRTPDPPGLSGRVYLLLQRFLT